MTTQTTINNSRHNVLRHRGQGLCSQQRAGYLRNVWRAAWQAGRFLAGAGNPGDGNGGPHHHGALQIFVPASKAAVMAEVMDFVGCTVDESDDVNPDPCAAVLGYRSGDEVLLYSRGYWAHDY